MIMNNDDALEEVTNPYPWGNNTYDTEDDYPPPWDWSAARKNSQPIDPRIQRLLAKQPVRPIDTDVSNPPTVA